MKKAELVSSKEVVSRKDVVRVIAVLLSNWYFLLVIPLITGGVSYLYTHRLADIYAAKCQILLRSNETYDYQEKIYKGLGFSSGYASYEETASQMRVIQSSGILGQVLDKLPLDVSYYIVGRLKITEVYKHLPFRVIADERSTKSTGIEYYVSIINEDSFELSYSLGGETRKIISNFGDLILEDGLLIKIEKSASLNELTVSPLTQVSYMFRLTHRQRLLSKYQSALSVRNLDYTSIVEINLQDEIPERAVEILDTLSEIYVNSTLENKVDINNNTLVYIDKQLDEVIGIINDIEKELESFKEQKEILNLTKEEDTYFARLTELQVQKRKFEFELESLDDLTTHLLKEESVDGLIPPNIFISNTDPDLSNQIKELYELRTQYIEMLNKVTSMNEGANQLLDKINRLKTFIIRYIDSQQNGIYARIEELESEMAGLESKIKNIPKTQRQILNIERRLAVNEELYSFLLSKRAETVIARAAIIPRTKVIEKARSVGVVFPNKSRMNLMAILGGLIGAIVIVVLKELFFQKISSLGQLQTSTDLSILGSILKIKDFSGTNRIVSGIERSDMAQSFRMLRTNLQYFTPDPESNVILVTSLLPGEGKTFTSVNLASVLAIADKKVLIMDFDLHKPRLAKAMEMENLKGVSSILIGDVKFDDAIQQTDIPTMHVLTSGPVPPNASELILRPELGELMSLVRERYDYVFIDTPPVSLISDGLILMRSADVKLFVLNSKSTSKTSLDYIERLIENNGLDHCALILNEEKRSKLDYYYSRYGYGGYGYGGYGYGGYGQYES